MRIRYSYHVQKRARERLYGLDDVDRVVTEHISSWEDARNRSLVLTGSAEGSRRLRVCLVHPPEKDGEVFVKTAYWVDSEAKGGAK